MGEEECDGGEEHEEFEMGEEREECDGDDEQEEVEMGEEECDGGDEHDYLREEEEVGNVVEGEVEASAEECLDDNEEDKMANDGDGFGVENDRVDQFRRNINPHLDSQARVQETSSSHLPSTLSHFHFPFHRASLSSHTITVTPIRFSIVASTLLGHASFFVSRTTSPLHCHEEHFISHQFSLAEPRLASISLSRAHPCKPSAFITVSFWHSHFLLRFAFSPSTSASFQPFRPQYIIFTEQCFVLWPSLGFPSSFFILFEF
ncbi:hypothetical protein LR48_Vigan08g093800 [Vigna angularis]|uniref:Uncharacterized protein n=1 Tax=Phaseolus angularis TaxID=3914 RepID=A0A0L9V518_PHAAN|nr:hypothetical protein LR48_Vigan08g093800 [Vigna angularis]